MTQAEASCSLPKPGIVLSWPPGFVIATLKEPSPCGESWNVAIAMPVSISLHYCNIFNSLSEYDVAEYIAMMAASLDASSLLELIRR
jgi:hypothetical protein